LSASPNHSHPVPSPSSSSVQATPTPSTSVYPRPGVSAPAPGVSAPSTPQASPSPSPSRQSPSPGPKGHNKSSHPGRQAPRPKVPPSPIVGKFFGPVQGEDAFISLADLQKGIGDPAQNASLQSIDLMRSGRPAITASGASWMPAIIIGVGPLFLLTISQGFMRSLGRWSGETSPRLRPRRCFISWGFRI
jgi:hypothetical protein